MSESCSSAKRLAKVVLAQPGRIIFEKNPAQAIHDAGLGEAESKLHWMIDNSGDESTKAHLRSVLASLTGEELTDG